MKMNKIFLCGAILLLISVIGTTRLFQKPILKPAGTNIYNSTQRNAFQCDGILVEADEMHSRLRLTNQSTGKGINFPRNPLWQGDINTSSIFGADGAVFFLKANNASDEFVAVESKSMPQMSVVRIDLVSLEEQIVFSTDACVFKNIATSGHLNMLSQFFLNEHFLFVLSDRSIYQINLVTGFLEILPIDFHSQNIAFDGLNIYYVQQDAQLFKYNTKTQASLEIGDLAVKDFYLTRESIYYINRRDHDTVYSYNLTDGISKKVSDTCAQAVEVFDKTLFLTSAEDGKVVQLPITTFA